VNGGIGDDEATTLLQSSFITMEESIRRFAVGLGQEALAQNWLAVHSMLAPWLRTIMTTDDVRAFFEDQYRATLEASGIDELHYPGYPEPDVGGNSHTNATALRQPMSWQPGRIRHVPAEVTDENMRYWAKVQLQCSDEQMEAFDIDYLAEVWIAVVETEEGLRVGYWTQDAN
jgi:hypothetical protein